MTGMDNVVNLYLIPVPNISFKKTGKTLHVYNNAHHITFISKQVDVNSRTELFPTQGKIISGICTISTLKALLSENISDMSTDCLVKILFHKTVSTSSVVGLFTFIINIAATELLLQPRSYMFSDNSTRTAYRCASGTNLSSIATSQTDCCLTCLTNAQMNCLVGNYYPTDGRCEIFEVWTEASSVNLPTCTNFRKIGICPQGFRYLPLIKTCLLLIPSLSYTWESGLKYCSALRSNTSMVIVDSAVKATTTCQESTTWTGGSRLNRSSTSEDYFWFGPNNLTILQLCSSMENLEPMEQQTLDDHWKLQHWCSKYSDL
ncbi:hypothetical protein HELRODRAFT_183935 [Helobdella robusta]|uniref:Uncharacterized protein n=1 Tax=Helobdella robusta TaxID=6412 RepID=T1FKB5_HELRO|nr:hypothetical protein HELRODRAFT_183935 [Helobdella robusta]ESO09717.1 hypothetical protein HELRODRAFT_183935 [Helobdella robusta]